MLLHEPFLVYCVGAVQSGRGSYKVVGCPNDDPERQPFSRNLSRNHLRDADWHNRVQGPIQQSRDFSYQISVLIIRIMEQQLIESTIEIVPATMEEVLTKLQGVLAANPCEEAVLANTVKSLFYGLWNFDKMINQHLLSTRISELLIKLPRKNALNFFKSFVSLLREKWNFIDHHRINKFMLLVRYLLANAFKLCQKHKLPKSKVDKILFDLIFSPTLLPNGLTYHLIDIYFDVLHQQKGELVTLADLALFEKLLFEHPEEHLRLYILEHTYEKYKDNLIQTYGNDLDKLEDNLQQFIGYFLELAKTQQDEKKQKTLFTLVAYAKSEQVVFKQFWALRQQKAAKQTVKKVKQISKSKKEEVNKLKTKRKQKKKRVNKDKKIQSIRKFQDKSKYKNGLEDM